MLAQRPDSSTLTLSWQNPTAAAGWSLVDEIRIEFNESFTPGKRIWIKLPPTAQSVSLPVALVAQAGFNVDSPTLTWRIQTRAYDENNYNIARGYSNSLAVN